MLNFKVLTTL